MELQRRYERQVALPRRPSATSFPARMDRFVSLPLGSVASITHENLCEMSTP